MIMPTKIIKPVDSLICISPYILDILKNNSMSMDDLLIRLNKTYYKNISIDTLILCIDFLFITGKIKDNNETTTFNQPT